MFVFTEFNETVSEPERGSEPDERQKKGRAAGSLLAEITLCLIATVERSCRGSQAQRGTTHSAVAVMNRRCHLPAPI